MIRSLEKGSRLFKCSLLAGSIVYFTHTLIVLHDYFVVKWDYQCLREKTANLPTDGKGRTLLNYDIDSGRSEVLDRISRLCNIANYHIYSKRTWVYSGKEAYAVSPWQILWGTVAFLPALAIWILLGTIRLRSERKDQTEGSKTGDDLNNQNP